MNPNEDLKWQALVKGSTATFSGEETLPFGLATGTLARLREERRQQVQLEKIGLRALFASLAALAVVAAITVELHLQNRSDLEPGIRSLIQVENFPIS